MDPDVMPCGHSNHNMLWSRFRLTLLPAALRMRTFTDHVMLFTQTKKQAHRMHILLGLLGLQVGELHGNLSQTQRLEALR